MANYIGLDRVFKVFRIVRENGGWINSYMKLYRWAESDLNAFIEQLYNLFCSIALEWTTLRTER